MTAPHPLPTHEDPARKTRAENKLLICFVPRCNAVTLIVTAFRP